ncbi:MAG: RIP metalloprotease RseP [Clostridiaceae bacterium]|nr:RIP metalloprotease RseP [Clostridiaceae bacterium]
MSILIALIVLSVLIIIHELGHFTAAKLSGIKVLEFSLFMGPKLFSFKKGETEYSLRLIPMGGYVKMEGENEDSDDPRAFSNQTAGKRALVIGAGPVLNILFAFLIAAIVMTQTGFFTNIVYKIDDNSPLKEIGIEVGDKIISYGGRRLFDPSSDISIFMYAEDGKPKDITFYDVSENKKVKRAITPGRTETRFRLGFTATDDSEGSKVLDLEIDSPLEKAGVRRGDRIIKLDDTVVNSTQEIITFLNVTRPDKTAPVDVTVDRNGKTLTFENIKPFSDYQYTLGVSFQHKKGNVFEIIKASFDYSISTIRNVLISLRWLFDGTVSIRELSGPVGIIGSVGSVVQTQQPVGVKFLNLLYFSSFISISLGVMNLMPIPALDGSLLLIILIEKIRGKRISQEKVGMVSMVGFFLLIALFIVTLFNDIPRWLF